MKRMMVVLVLASACVESQPHNGEPANPARHHPPNEVPSAGLPPPPATGGTWQPLANQPAFSASLSLLLPDGTVMVQDVSSPNWWRLTPDATGSYVNGTWTQRGTMPNGYAPLYFASAVLPDGRVIAEGGEYQAGASAWTTQGAIYDPISDKWTAVTPPTGWTSIGDASGIVLPNGRFMLANCCTTQEALLDPVALTWSPTGTGKEDENDEESWTLLPDGNVLTVDANNPGKPTESELYNPASGTWSSGGSTVVQLEETSSHEIGPAVLRADGTVFATGATGHNAIYDTHSKAWTAAPDFPVVGGMQLDVADGPAALLPNGNVLVAASPGDYQSPTTFFEFDGSTLTTVGGTPNASFDSSYNVNMLVLPTGQIFVTDQSADVEIYNPAPGTTDNAVPVITSIPQSAVTNGPLPLTTLHRSQTYEMWAKRPNGISQGGYYGDDAQAATSFPLVRLTNQGTNHVTFARTHDGSTYAIGPDVTGSTHFDIPADAELGATSMSIIANGIASPAVTVEID